MNTEPVVVEKTFHVRISQLWKALTSETEMKNWYFDIPGFRAEVGYEFRFYAGTKDRQYIHICKIIQVIPEQKISYTWRYEGYDGESTVTFQLNEENGSTSLKVTHEGVETFHPHNPDLSRENFETGWRQFILHSLTEYLEKSVVISMGG